jgi:transketolase
MALNPEMNLARLEEAAKKENWQACKKAYGAALLALAQERSEVVCLDADLANSTEGKRIRDAEDHAVARRFFDVGISEQDLVGTAAGFALAGKLPYANSFGVFLSGRAWDQIRVSVCYPNLKVRFGGPYGGITVGPDGSTHFAISDIALLRSLPNLNLVSAADAAQVAPLMRGTADVDGPVYIRMGRVPQPVITTVETPFEFGRIDLYREGHELAVFATGHLVYYALAAAEELSRVQGVETAVLNVSTIKPLDADTILEYADRCNHVATVEEHNVYGGLGGAVAEVLAENDPTPLKIIGVRDVFAESGEPDALLAKYGLDARGIYRQLSDFLDLPDNEGFSEPD